VASETRWEEGAAITLRPISGSESGVPAGLRRTTSRPRWRDDDRHLSSVASSGVNMSKAILPSIFVAALMLPSAAVAKGITTKIVITGEGVTTPVEITDPAVLERFAIWSGPGTYANGVEGTEGFVIDWKAGALSSPVPQAKKYQVSFYVKFWNQKLQQFGPESKLAYVVWADIADGQAYVYLPGPNDAEFRLNAKAMHHGTKWEGNWFRANREWQEVWAGLVRNREVRSAASRRRCDLSSRFALADGCDPRARPPEVQPRSQP
jgi:hypothetical protein